MDFKRKQFYHLNMRHSQSREKNEHSSTLINFTTCGNSLLQNLIDIFRILSSIVLNITLVNWGTNRLHPGAEIGHSSLLSALTQ